MLIKKDLKYPQYHTRISTNLKYRNVGDTVNLECDIIGKYVEKLLGYSECNEKKKSKITESYLIENGFLKKEGI